METTALDVAKYIVNFFQELGKPINNRHLQHLLYYVQGWNLGLFQKPLFHDDFEAWIQGPVIPLVFSEYKGICKQLWKPILKKQKLTPIPDKIKKHILNVLNEYGEEIDFLLEKRTRTEAPWLEARGEKYHDEDSNAIITKESMRDFFTEQAFKPKIRASII